MGHPTKYGKMTRKMVADYMAVNPGISLSTDVIKSKVFMVCQLEKLNPAELKSIREALVWFAENPDSLKQSHGGIIVRTGPKTFIFKPNAETRKPADIGKLEAIISDVEALLSKLRAYAKAENDKNLRPALPFKSDTDPDLDSSSGE